MLKRRLCEASFTWNLSCEGPLLIADGRYLKPEGAAPENPQKIFISRLADQAVGTGVGPRAESLARRPFYIPGTSLRGPFRAQAERILRSLSPGDALPPATACNPFDMEAEIGRSCSRRLDRTAFDFPYAEACPACKLFGCTGTASRVQFTDADIPPGGTVKSVYRDMIGIDRFTGGACSGAKMRVHVLEGAAFTTTVTVQNFELWQLGLLAYVFQDFADGLVSLGFGKSKGFGQVKGEVESATLTYPKGKPPRQVHHLGSLASAEERRDYGLDDREPPPCTMRPAPGTGWSLYEKFQVEDLEALWREAARAFNARMEAAAAPVAGR